MSFATSQVLHGQRGIPVKVLIADDHPVVRQGLKQMLSSDPELEVVGEARDGDEAFEKAHQVDWDVAVLDYSMPGRGGVELLSDVKHDYPERPVLILSIYPEDPHGLRALKAGAAGYVVKRSAAKAVVDAIRAVHAGQRYLSPRVADVVIDDYAGDGADDLLGKLSQREREVLQLLAEGHTGAQIAERLSLSQKTVETYRARLVEKLGIRDVAGLVRFAIQRGIVSLD